MIISALVVAALAVAFVFSMLGAMNKKEQAKELSRSNARVLREYKRMVVYRPNHIVNYANNRREHGHGNAHTRSAAQPHLLPQEQGQD